MKTIINRFASGRPVNTPNGPAVVIEDQGMGFLPLVFGRHDLIARYVARYELEALPLTDDTCTYCGGLKELGHELEPFHQAAARLVRDRYNRRLTLQ